MTTPTRREKCNHNILRCGGCGEFVAMMTRAEERLIQAALRYHERYWSKTKGLVDPLHICRAARSVQRERTRDAKKGEKRNGI